MKYIRIKNKIYIIEKEDCSSYWLKNHPSLRWVAKEQFKVADTIEELCDEFVYITSRGKKIVEAYFSRNNGIEIINVYGAIWTDKGLIFVAKINDKGELELI